TARAKLVCQAVASYDAQGHNLQFAVATGLSQWANPWNNVGVVETEADYVQRNFVNDTTCGPHYFQWQDPYTLQTKPLIANYFKDTAQKNYWQNQYPHTYTQNFTMKY